MRYKSLMNGGGHMMDFVALKKEYKDVVEFLKKVPLCLPK